MRPMGLIFLFLLLACWANAATADTETLTLVTRFQEETAKGSGQFQVIHKVVHWDLRKTAIIICDMWDKHWCGGATQRVGEMAPAMNEVVQEARKRGLFIIHSPSETMGFYKDTPQRKRAQQAPKAQTPTPAQDGKSVGRAKAPPLPIDDSDGGCDTVEKPWYRAWTRQHADIQIAAEDAISDNGEEVYNLLQQRGIDNVIIMGVHTNMCVLNRPFAIRRLVALGKNVVLMRDMTDTMYNPRRPPFVSHFRGTDLVVEHIERYWSPTITSTDFTGKPAFRFKADKRPHVVFVLSEDEYNAKETVVPFAREELEGRLDYRCTFLQSDSKTDVPGLQALKDADLAVFYIRRRTLPEDQIGYIKSYLDSGKPLVALRTSSHAFQNWPGFDADVLGGHYQGHHNNKNPTDPATYIKVIAEAVDHPILTGVSRDEFRVTSWLYKVLPLAPTATPLMMGRVEGRLPHEPVAWVNTHKGGRVFYTSLGHPDDFKLEPFRRLLLNGILWALNQPILGAAIKAP